MTAQDELVALAEEAARRKLTYELIGMTNTVNKTPAERIDLDASFMVARGEWDKAQAAYEDALRDYRPTHPAIRAEERTR